MNTFKNVRMLRTNNAIYYYYYCFRGTCMSYGFSPPLSLSVGVIYIVHWLIPCPPKPPKTSVINIGPFVILHVPRYGYTKVYVSRGNTYQIRGFFQLYSRFDRARSRKPKPYTNIDKKKCCSIGKSSAPRIIKNT